MTSKRPYTCIAVVSGKGGVGKTTLAANLAKLISSAPKKVMLVDLDFANRGCTALFASDILNVDYNAMHFLGVTRDRLSEDAGPFEIVALRVSEGIRFIPAPIFLEGPHDSPLRGYSSEVIEASLRASMDKFHHQDDTDCFILDCHGGADAASIAAATVCDVTLVVTEADSITFGGTLALVDGFYQGSGSGAVNPCLEFVVNRAPSKFRWQDLNEIYNKYLNRFLGHYTGSGAVLAYIPVAEYLAESFGEHPFQVDLAPSSVFARKLELLLFRLFNLSKPELLSTRIRKRCQQARYVRRLERTLESETHKVTNAMLGNWLLLSALFWMSLLVSPLWAAKGTLTGADEAQASELQMADYLVLSPLIAVSFLLFLFFFYTAFQVFFYYRNRLKFQKRLVGAISPVRAKLRRIELYKLRIYYWTSAFLPGLVVFYLLLLVMAAALSLGSWVGSLLGLLSLEASQAIQG